MKSLEFKLLVMPFSSRLYRMAFRLMNNREEAEDIVQEVYVKLWEMRNELNNYNSIEALSIRITRNLCLDHLRRRKINQNALKAEKLKEEGYSVTPAENLEKKEEAEIIHTLIAALPEPQRSLVHLRHLEEKEYEEIAEMVNMNVNAIRVSISRARKQMREMLEKQYSSWKA
ncbi:MAG: sigma-70 family RNA polymerase sigma factor [Bacteroidales bacterium]|nr:sigma-70 family RNA polymerase sigma factor [Bacteroidales bacterium]